MPDPSGGRHRPPTLFGLLVLTAIAAATPVLLGEPYEYSVFAAVAAAAVLSLLLSRALDSATAAILVVSATLLSRPGLIGESVGGIGLALYLGPALMTLPNVPLVRSSMTRMAALALGFAAVPLALGHLENGANVVTLLGGTVVALLAGVKLGLRERHLSAILALMAVLIGWQALGGVVSAAIHPDPVLHLSGPLFSGRDYDYALHSTGAVSAGSGGVFDWLPFRLTGWLGEPGLFGALAAIVALLDLANTRRFRIWVQVACLTAAVLSQSVSALLVYLFGLSLTLVASASGSEGRARRLAGGLAAAVAGVLAILYGGLNLEAKAAANVGSVEDRLGGVNPVELLSTWLRYPLGTGSDNSVNLLQASSANGPIIFVAGIALFLVVPLLTKGRRAALGCHAAVFLTVLLAQPPGLPIWMLTTGLALGLQLRTTLAEPIDTSVEAQDQPRVRAANPAKMRRLSPVASKLMS